MSLKGCLTNEYQNCFEEKAHMSATTTKEVLNSRGIAFSCIKGQKPNSAQKKNQDTFSIVLWNQWKIIGVFDGHGS